MSPIGSVLQPLAHKFSTPPFSEAQVVDAMRMGLVTCPPDATLTEVARVMATYQMHCVLVRESDEGQPVGVVTDRDLAASAGEQSRTAAEIALDPVRVAADESLPRATRLMVDEGVSHLLVVQPATGHAVGVLSTLDVADVLAWGESSS